MDYMYERLHVPYPLTIEVTSHRVLSCSHADVGSASVCKYDMPMQVVLYMSHSLAGKHSQILLCCRQVPLIAAVCIKITADRSNAGHVR